MSSAAAVTPREYTTREVTQGDDDDGGAEAIRARAAEDEGRRVR